MARVHIRNEEHERLIEVTLSRRNLLALLHKLEMPGSACTLLNHDCWEDGIQTPVPGKDDSGVALPPTTLVLRCEDDPEHYRGREAPAGRMHPATERFCREQTPTPPKERAPLRRLWLSISEHVPGCELRAGS